MNKSKREEFTVSYSNDNNSAVLAKLSGPCADITNPTRNGRKYNESLWEKVFNSDIVKEHFEAGGIFGELGHPADRSETDMEKIAICMRKPPVKDKNGLLVGTWDVLDTPNGRILKTLIDYGYKMGISSRGTGETYEDVDGEYVDEDTYDFQAFDAVLLPAVKAARLSPVMESYGKKTLRQALNEQMNKASEKDRKIMEETLANLKLNEGLKSFDIRITNTVSEVFQIKAHDEDEALSLAEDGWYDGEFVIQDDGQGLELEVVGKSFEEKVNIENSTEPNEANDEGSEELLKSLQEALKANSELSKQVIALQNEIAVSDTKVTKLMEDVATYKATVAKLSKAVVEKERLAKQVNELKESLATKEEQVEKQTSSLRALHESKSTTNKAIESLNESIVEKDNTISQLNEQIQSQKDSYEGTIENLQEELANEKLSNETTIKNLNSKINKATHLAEQYKKLTRESVSRYIKTKATMLGISPNEIKNRLSENYTLDEIDAICDDLQDYNVNVSKLPFSFGKGNKGKVKVTESKDPLTNVVDKSDDIDDNLLRLAKLN